MTNSAAGPPTALLAWLEMPTWRQQGCEASWQEFLGAAETEFELRASQRCTHTGRPLRTRGVRRETGTVKRCQAPFVSPGTLETVPDPVSGPRSRPPRSVLFKSSRVT